METELKFLQEKNGKVVRQEFGPCTTKDLADAVMVVTVDLLKDALDRWHTVNRVAVGSTAAAPLRSGREQERQQAHGLKTADATGRGARNRELLETARRDRARATRSLGRGRTQPGTPDMTHRFPPISLLICYSDISIDVTEGEDLMKGDRISVCLWSFVVTTLICYLLYGAYATGLSW